VKGSSLILMNEGKRSKSLILAKIGNEKKTLVSKLMH